jgi:hypothetical protein
MYEFYVCLKNTPFWTPRVRKRGFSIWVIIKPSWEICGLTFMILWRFCDQISRKNELCCGYNAKKDLIFPFLARIMVSFFNQNARKNHGQRGRASEWVSLKFLNAASEREQPSPEFPASERGRVLASLASARSLVQLSFFRTLIFTMCMWFECDDLKSRYDCDGNSNLSHRIRIFSQNAKIAIAYANFDPCWRVNINFY